MKNLNTELKHFFTNTYFGSQRGMFIRTNPTRVSIENGIVKSIAIYLPKEDIDLYPELYKLNTSYGEGFFYCWSTFENGISIENNELTSEMILENVKYAKDFKLTNLSIGNELKIGDYIKHKKTNILYQVIRKNGVNLTLHEVNSLASGYPRGESLENIDEYTFLTLDEVNSNALVYESLDEYLKMITFRQDQIDDVMKTKNNFEWYLISHFNDYKADYHIIRIKGYFEPIINKVKYSGHPLSKW